MMMLKLKNSKWIRDYEFSADLLDEATIENRQAIEMAKIYSDIQSGMMDAFASVISNNLNIVMKSLTIITIILDDPDTCRQYLRHERSQQAGEQHERLLVHSGRVSYPRHRGSAADQEKEMDVVCLNRTCPSMTNINFKSLIKIVSLILIIVSAFILFMYSCSTYIRRIYSCLLSILQLITLVPGLLFIFSFPAQ